MNAIIPSGLKSLRVGNSIDLASSVLTDSSTKRRLHWSAYFLVDALTQWEQGRTCLVGHALAFNKR
jgi:hypothetical protein